MNRTMMVVAAVALSFVGIETASAQTVIVADDYAAPVYAAPAPVYGAPVVVTEPRVYAAPGPVYVAPPRQVVVTEPPPLVTADTAVTYTAW